MTSTNRLRDAFTRVAMIGFAVSLVALVLVSCKERPDQAPATESEFQSRIVWSSKPVPQHFLRLIMRYCSDGFRNSGCVDLDNGQPSAAFVTRLGHVVFFDHKAGLVEFDSAGRYVDNIGSLGNDPGSYRNVAALGTDSARTFTLWDPELDRVTVLKSNELGRHAWVSDERIESVLIADTLPIALAIPLSKNQGDRVVARIAPIKPNGKLAEPIAFVSSLSTTDDKWKTRGAVPNFYWPRPIWSLGEDKSVAYVPPDTTLRIEFYNAAGRPQMLITGTTPFPGEPITEDEISRFRAAWYFRVLGKPLPPEGKCGVNPNGSDNPDTSVECQSVDYFHAIGKRSPRSRPPVTDIVSFAPHGFWVRTSRIQRDSATWLIADSTGNLVGSVNMKTAERPIGRHHHRTAVADSTDGRISVSWRELVR